MEDPPVFDLDDDGDDSPLLAGGAEPVFDLDDDGDDSPPLLGETQLQPAEGIEGAVQTLFRAVRTLRTYPIDNEVSVRALANLAPRLTEVLPLTLGLEAQRLHSEGRTLTDEHGSLPPLVGDLYRDGVRRLRLERKLSGDEMSRFVMALAKPLNPSDLSEDYVTRLWEADLPHVRIFAIDPYLDLDTPDEVLEGMPEAATGVGEDAPESSPPIPFPPDLAFQLEPDEQARVAQEVEQAGASVHWGEFVSALFEAATMPALEPRKADFAEIFEACFFRLLSELQLDFAIRILEQLRSQADPAVASVFGPSLTRIARTDRLEPLNEALRSGACRPKDGISLLVLLAPESVGAVCDFLEQAGSDRSSRVYADVLTRIGEPAASSVLRRFPRASGDARRLYARVLGGLESEGVASTLLDALSEPDPAVRREIVKAVATHRDPRGGAARLRLALEDPDPETRMIALRGLDCASTKVEEETILRRVQSQEYPYLSPEEKDLLFHVLSTVGKEQAVAELQTILRHSWIPGRTRRDDWPRAAAALARLATPAAIEVLEAASQSRNAELAVACTSALRTAKKAQE